MTTIRLIERPATQGAVALRLQVVDQHLSQLESDLRDLWHQLVADEPVLAARVRIAANYLRNAAVAMSSGDTDLS